MWAVLSLTSALAKTFRKKGRGGTPFFILMVGSRDTGDSDELTASSDVVEIKAHEVRTHD